MFCAQVNRLNAEVEEERSARRLLEKVLTKMSEEQNSVEEVADDLIPKPPPKLAPRGITSFTVFRQQDETGVSGEGVVIEGVVMATGQCVVHWLYPPPRGGIAIFDSMSDFVKVHIEPHPANQTIITYQDGTKDVYGDKPEEDKGEEKQAPTI